MTRARHRLEAALAALGSWALRAAGGGLARAAGAGLGALWYRVDAAHRRIARENLALAFPDMTEARREAVARASFRHFGAVAVDLLRFPAYGPADAERLAEVRGWDHLEAAVRRGRGVIVFSGHYGHWELVALVQAFRGIPMDMVTRPLDNPLLEARLAAARTACGNRLVRKRDAVRGSLRALRAGRAVALVIDQNFRERNRIFVEFFGRPAATSPALGLLAVRTGAAIVPVFSWPGEGGRLVVEYQAPRAADASADPADEAMRLTRECTRRLEEQIRRAPEPWLWMHRRWRTRPAEPGAEARAPGLRPGEARR